MNTQYFRSGSLVADFASGKRTFFKLPSPTTADSTEMLTGKEAFVELANLAVALFVNWVVLGLVVSLSVALVG